MPYLIRDLTSYPTALLCNYVGMEYLHLNRQSSIGLLWIPRTLKVTARESNLEAAKELGTMPSFPSACAMLWKRLIQVSISRILTRTLMASLMQSHSFTLATTLQRVEVTNLAFGLIIPS